MPGTVEHVMEEVLSLPADVRLGMVEAILRSLNLPTRREIDQAWAEEAERRVAQVESGDVQLIDGEEVIAEARRKYGR